MQIPEGLSDHFSSFILDLIGTNELDGAGILVKTK